MPTRIDWLPYGMFERAVTLRSLANGIDEVAPHIGLSQARVDRIKAIADEYEFALTVYTQNKAAAKAMRTWRDSVMSSKRVTGSAENRPVFNNDSAPVGMKRGLIYEIREFVRIIKASPGYLTQYGILLRILSPNHVKPELREVQPKIKVTSIEGFRIKIAAEMKGMSAIEVEYKRNGTEKPERIAILTNLPATLYIAPAVLGVPESGTIRCVFLKRNVRVGGYSPGVPVTLFAA